MLWRATACRPGRHAAPAGAARHSFTIRPGSTLGVIGESGCGKSTLARVIAGLLPAARGEVALHGIPLPSTLGKRSREQLRQVQIVFQMADTALNPSQSVRRILGRPLEFSPWPARGERRSE